ncbi:MAG: hypothetical protein CL844_03710 [Crocinitomicaceae bacterium]|nr:hypothetical protein [Crocinitomicaceae bacterium]
MDIARARFARGKRTSRKARTQTLAQVEVLEPAGFALVQDALAYQSDAQEHGKVQENAEAQKELGEVHKEKVGGFLILGAVGVGHVHPFARYQTRTHKTQTTLPRAAPGTARRPRSRAPPQARPWS